MKPSAWSEFVRTPPTGLPVVLYELNEVPWRVIDWYISRKPASEIARLMQNAACLTTHTHDVGELSPWSTWPTLHRGVYNDTHKISFINQDKTCAQAYPPVWETAAAAGMRVGVFGSLQSYPVPASPEFVFYVPDTFAQTPDTIPPEYSAFQRINLRQTRADGAVAQDVKIDLEALRDVLALPKIGVTGRTLAALGLQLIKEKLEPLHRARRALLQPVVAFDVFIDAVKRYRPEFCTFFTNHVAGTMHRYWKHTFPQDFDFKVETKQDHFHSESLCVAMDIADAQIGLLRRHVEKTDGQLVIASSMGQEPIIRPHYEGELRIFDAGTLARRIGFHKHFENHLAMHPDFTFEFDSPADREEFAEKAMRLCYGSGHCIWFSKLEKGSTLNLSLESPSEVLERKLILLRQHDGTLQPVPLHELGIQTIFRDEGTAYHQPRGILIWFQSGLAAISSRDVIESIEVRRMLLAALGLQCGVDERAHAA